MARGVHDGLAPPVVGYGGEAETANRGAGTACRGRLPGLSRAECEDKCDEITADDTAKECPCITFKEDGGICYVYKIAPATATASEVLPLSADASYGDVYARPRWAAGHRPHTDYFDDAATARCESPAKEALATGEWNLHKMFEYSTLRFRGRDGRPRRRAEGDTQLTDWSLPPPTAVAVDRPRAGAKYPCSPR